MRRLRTVRNPPHYTQNKNPNRNNPSIKFTLFITDPNTCSSTSCIPTLRIRIRHTSGVRHIEIPIGSTLFAESFLDTAASTFATTLHKLSHLIHDHQTMTAIYQHCAITSLPHLLATDVYHHTSTNTTPNLFAWHSPFASKIQQAGDTLLPYDSHRPTPTISSLIMAPCTHSNPCRWYWLS
jgi:hypothetical protein